ncbi:hypothetical protein [Oceanidesulfovibrio indonesiensis]|uniref:hypothetical protein n=1 Tax=Oceanidesulfovibrio indonesiensis TaxID=54767 RepID=UPI0012947DB0|nr:hypothetical protein [Oceanidesulfovibrio indonesiensis]
MPNRDGTGPWNNQAGGLGRGQGRGRGQREGWARRCWRALGFGNRSVQDNGQQDIPGTPDDDMAQQGTGRGLGPCGGGMGPGGMGRGQGGQGMGRGQGRGGRAMMNTGQGGAGRGQGRG